MLPPLNVFNWLIALSPIIVVVILMVKLRWGGSKAGPLGWILSILVSVLFFGADLKVVTVGSLKGLWTTIFVLYIIWGALGLYNVVDKVKGFDVIAMNITAWTGGNRLLQLFAIGWAFPSFIQGVCGFGAPVAISAPLLVGLGFTPVLATIAVLIGHAWSITFGSLGSSYAVMVNISGLDPQGLAFWSSNFLVINCILSGFILAYLYDGRHGLFKSIPTVIFIGLVMGGSFWITINYINPYIGSLVGGLVGLVVASRVSYYMPWYKEQVIGTRCNVQIPSGSMSFLESSAAYLILVGIVFIFYLTPLREMLSWAKVGTSFPQTATAFGYMNPEVESYAPINLITTPGTLIFLTVFLTILYYRQKGCWQQSDTIVVLGKLVKQANPTTITVMSMSMMSVVMMEAGMTKLLAHGVSAYSGELYPLFAPLLGALGSFMTGSNTSSNILFSAFQRDVAGILNLNAVVILSLQTVGGSLGCMFSPMKVALGTGVTGIVGSEGEIIKKTLKYGLILCLLSGLLGLVIIRFI